MKKVLILSYYFPPNAGAHVQRIAKFVKYLPQFGFEPVILTNRNKLSRQDRGLLDDVGNCKIYYASDPGKLMPGTVRKFFFKYLQPDKLKFWKTFAVPKALKIIKNENISLLFTSIPPHSVSCLASKVAKRSKLPLVIDMRDEWITFPLFTKKKFASLNKDIYYKNISACSTVTTVNKTLKKRISEDLKSNNTDKPVHTVYNGFDADDIPQNINYESSQQLKICYNGRFKHISDPTFFFSVLNKMIKNSVLNINEIRLIFTDDISNQKWISKYPLLYKITEFTGYLSLKDSYKLIAKCDIGLILLTNYAKSTALPLKMFDYAALDKPILAVVDKEDELTDLIKNYQASEILFTDQEKNASDKILDFFNRVRANKTIPERSFKKEFDRKVQTDQLSKIFKTLL
ncbi:MAG: glycosyltransferase [Candidatus Delongbacteria bacterium]